MNPPARQPTTITLPRFNRGVLVVCSESRADDTYLGTVRGGPTDVALFPREAWALADSHQQFAAAAHSKHFEAAVASAFRLTMVQDDDIHAVARRHRLRARSV